MKRKAKVITVSMCVVIIAGLAALWWREIFGDACIYFEGVDLPSRVEMGETFPVTVFIRPRERAGRECMLFIHFVPQGFDAPVVNADVSIPVPLRDWKPGERVALGPFRCTIPLGWKAGRYTVRAGLFYLGELPLGGPRFIRIPYCNKIWKRWDVGTIEAVEPSPRSYPEGAFGGDGYAVGFAGPLEKIFPEKGWFAGALDGKARISAARNEYESFQLVVIPGEGGLADVRLAAGDLVRRGGGGVIDAGHITIRRVGYVKARRPYYNVKRVGMWPDPLIPDDGDSVTIAPGTVQPFWITVFVPPETPPGDYEGGITVRPADLPEKRVPLSLKVWNFSLPEKSSLPTGFDFYEYLVRKCYPRRAGESDEEWKERISELCRRYYLDMLEHRISPIHNVGNARLVGVRDGKYILDFTEFGKRVEFYTRAGQTAFGIAREARLDPGRNVWSGSWYGFTGPEAVRAVFRAYGEYLEKRGWLGRAYTYIIDESYVGVESLFRLIHEGHPGIRNLLTQTPRDGYPDVDIWCVRLNNFDEAVADEFRARGKEIWIYVASPTRPFPTINLESPSLDVRILPWICWRFRIGGLLYWCVNFWHHSNPWEDPMTWPDQNGNGYLFYPGAEGPVDSIRLEVLRDGLEDYEYLRLFGEVYSDDELQAAIAEMIPSTWNYNDDPERLVALREAIGEKLSKPGLFIPLKRDE